EAGLARRDLEDSEAPQRRRPEVAPHVPCRPREVLVAEPLAPHPDEHAVALLAQPERRDAPAEAPPAEHLVVRRSGAFAVAAGGRHGFGGRAARRNALPVANRERTRRLRV